MNYSIVYHSAGNVIIHAFADIIDNILFVNNPCMTKDNYFYFDTIVVQANSAGLFVTDTLFISGESSSGVAQIKRNSFSVFPNPVENDLFILNTEENNSIYEITDLSGRKILQSFMQDAYTTKLDVHSLNSGIYLLKKTNSLGVKTIKFIKS